MAELDINKSGFDFCYDRLQALASKLHGFKNAMEESGGDTSLTGKKEQQCMEELSRIMEDIASLAEETAKDVKLTKARYVLADK